MAGAEPAAPLILVGTDTGALRALHAAASVSPAPSGPPLRGRGRRRNGTGGHSGCGEDSGSGDSDSVGRPGPDAGAGGAARADTGWESELDARTACPAHRARLTADASFERGALAAPVPDRLLGRAHTALPVLVLHGAADPVTPVAEARALAARLPLATLGVLREGRHDVLNDASHRSTAASLVLWLDGLRADRRHLRY